MSEPNPDHVRVVNLFSRNDIEVEVPLKFNGQIVGRAKILPSGNIECNFNSSHLGLRFRDLLTEGILDSFSVDSTMQPARSVNDI